MLPSQYPELDNYPTIKYVFEKQVDMIFVDLRCMLKSPASGCNAGYNLSIVTIILNLFSGFSTRLYWPASKLPDRKRFTNMLIDFFPWDDPASAKDLATLLYDAVRNPLTHELGIKGKHKIALLKSGKSTDEDIQILENSTTKPSLLPITFLRPQIGNISLEWHISINGLYWGTHRLLHNLLSKHSHVEVAEFEFEKLIKKHI